MGTTNFSLEKQALKGLDNFLILKDTRSMSELHDLNIQVSVYKGTDGATVVDILSFSDDVPIRVYLNDGFASNWLSPGQPGYGEEQLTNYSR